MTGPAGRSSANAPPESVTAPSFNAGAVTFAYSTGLPARATTVPVIRAASARPPVAISAHAATIARASRDPS